MDSGEGAIITSSILWLKKDIGYHFRKIKTPTEELRYDIISEDQQTHYRIQSAQVLDRGSGHHRARDRGA